MSKFNRLGTSARGAVSAVVAENTPSTTTYEGGPGYVRDVKGELFQLAVVNMVGESTFYEDASSRDTRFAQLVRQATIADADWTARLLKWLRTTANMRSAPLVGAAEYTRARLEAGLTGTSRQVVDSVLQRADEPGELLAYWTSRYGKKIPKPIKRGVADAAVRLYTEKNLLKYDTDSKGFRFADVIDLVHPVASAPWQHALFTHALDRRHGRVDSDISALPMIAENTALRRRIAATGDFAELLSSEVLRAAGMTWEDALSLAGSKVDKAKLWEAMIPSMGYMALLRNLRNFDQAGVSDFVAQTVATKLANADEVARSKQFPYRFLSAYEAAESSLRWNVALSNALDLSLANLPVLPGRTLVLVDTSGSMSQGGFSAKSNVTPVKAAALLGVALTRRNTAPHGTGQVNLYGFASGEFRHEIALGGATLHEVNRFVSRVGEVGHGTDMWGALRRTYQNHDRVFLITDMQTVTDRYAMGQAGSLPVPKNVPIYGFNLGGYASTAYAAGSPNRHEFGGLNDATLRAIPLLEAGHDAGWPF